MRANACPWKIFCDLRSPRHYIFNANGPNSQKFWNVTVTVIFYLKCEVAKSYKMGPNVAASRAIALLFYIGPDQDFYLCLRPKFEFLS